MKLKSIVPFLFKVDLTSMQVVYNITNQKINNLVNEGPNQDSFLYTWMLVQSPTCMI